MKEKDVWPPSQVIKPAKLYRMTYHFKKIGYIIKIFSFGEKSFARQAAKKAEMMSGLKPYIRDAHEPSK